MQALNLQRLRLVARWIVASVWIFHGVYSKLLHQIPRHEGIVARILGPDVAPMLTLGIGAAEAAMGLWVLSGRWPKLCATLQSLIIPTMNGLEIVLARDLLWNAPAMVLLNLLLLCAAWFAASGVRPRTAPPDGKS
ncbi:MAG: DoxX-like family protein [Leptospirales bacterium]|nr:DoxX-like family protein [Leptospirales bacterium]